MAALTNLTSRIHVWPLALAVALIVFPSAARCATTFIVTSTGDPGDGVCATSKSGDGCTLREAITAANSTAGDDVIVFAAGVTGTIQLTSALPNLSTNITLQGPGANLLTVRRNTGGNYRIFTVTNGTTSGPTVNISGLTLTNGFALAGSNPDYSAGGIYSENSTLSVSDCALIANYGYSGGGIVNLGSGNGNTSTLTVQRCTFTLNSTEYSGSAILNEGYSKGTAFATVQNCTFSFNGRGYGGIANSGNEGGATLTVKNSTFSNNGSFDITNSSSQYGDPSSATINVGNTIIQAGSGSSLDNQGPHSTITSLGYDVTDDNGGGFLTSTGDQLSVDPKLDPAGLQDNGGPTQTIALQSTSPALNAGDPNFTPPPAFDQRGNGFNRVARGRLDSGAFELQDAPQTGTNFIVTNTADHDDGVCGTSDCTLREAIEAANIASGSPTVQFASGLSGTITLTGGELAIAHAVTLSGPGARVITVDANLASRILSINAPGGSVVTISGLTLTRGQLVGDGLKGGGILNNAFTTLTDCTISNSSIVGDEGKNAFAGGIYNSSTLTLIGCTVSANSAAGGSLPTKSLTPTRGGSAEGGGIFNAGTLTLRNCTFSGNTAQGGRGGHNLNGRGGDGGDGLGGAIWETGTMTVTNCTFAANAAIHGSGGTGTTTGNNGAGQGGGLFSVSSADQAMGNTLVAGNTAAEGGPDVDGTFDSKGFNVVGTTDRSVGFTAMGDKTGTTASPLDPRIASLANNGGSTDTIALLAGSPAINAGNDANAPATDQRGASRAGPGDIGAFEFNGILPTPTPTATPSATPGATPTASPTATPGATPTASPRSGNLGNISTRLQVGTGNNVLFAGFIIQGSGSKTVLIRSAGPSLTSFGLPGAMSNPQLELHDANSTIGTNDNWQTTQLGGVITSDQVAAIQNSGAAPADPAEPAIIATLPAGSFTAIVQGASGTQGVATIEVYDLSPNNGGNLANISTRGFIQTGDNVMIGGFIDVGQTLRVLVRASGPSLTAFGIDNALGNPQIALHDANGTLAGNDDWQTTQVGGIITGDQSSAIQNSGLAPSNPAESAIIATLAPGSYTAIAQGVNGGTGVGVIEVFALP